MAAFLSFAIITMLVLWLMPASNICERLHIQGIAGNMPKNYSAALYCKAGALPVYDDDHPVLAKAA